MDLNLELDGDYFRETGFDLCGHILDLLTVNAAVLLIGENVTNLMLMPSVSSYIRHKDFLRSFVCPDIFKICWPFHDFLVFLSMFFRVFPFCVFGFLFYFLRFLRLLDFLELF